MKLLKPVEATVEKHLTEWHFRIRIFARDGYEEVPASEPTIKLLLDKGKRRLWFTYTPEQWEQVESEMDKGVRFIGQHAWESTGDVSYYYYCRGTYYVSAVQMSLDEVPMVLDAEREKTTQSLRNELERIKSKAESKGSNRAPIPESVQVLVWNRDGGKCVKCGSQENLEFDHIIPISKGGGDSARNIQLLCETCNRSKGGRIGG